MMVDRKLLIVGGTGRNVGKTEFLCSLIRRHSARHDIYALKVSAVFPEEAGCHGDHPGEATDWRLFEELSAHTAKDTSRMVRAGARRVFYLRCGDEGVQAGFETVRRQLPPEALLVCESNSLRLHVTPGLYIMVRAAVGAIKPRALPHLQMADLVVCSDGRSGFPELHHITLTAGGAWQLLASR